MESRRLRLSVFIIPAEARLRRHWADTLGKLLGIMLHHGVRIPIKGLYRERTGKPVIGAAGVVEKGSKQVGAGNIQCFAECMENFKFCKDVYRFCADDNSMIIMYLPNE